MNARRKIRLPMTLLIAGLSLGCDFTDTPSRAGKGFVSNPPVPPVSQEVTAAEEEYERANIAWQALVKESEPRIPPASWTNDPPSAEALNQWQIGNGQRAVKAADMAHEFSITFTNHPMAKQAVRIGLELLQIAGQHGDTGREDRIRELELIFLKGDPDQLFEFRFKGAQRAALAQKDLDPAQMIIELERQARLLQEEFPKREEVYNLLLTVAEGKISELEPVAEDIAAAMEILSEIEMANASEETKSAARELRKKGEIATRQLKELEERRKADLALLSSRAKAGAQPPAADALPAAATFEELKKDPLGKRMDLKFTAFDGREVDLSQLAGNVVLIDFWASWCGPCMEEIPTLRASYKKHRPDGFEIIGISLDSKKLPFERALAEEGITWPQIYDKDKWVEDLTDKLGIDDIPAMWLIDRKGIIRNIKAHEDIAPSIEALMKEK